VATRRGKVPSIDAELARVKALRDAGALSAALGDARARVVLAAANTVAENEIRGCDAALVEAFSRLVKQPDPGTADPQCRAKVGVLEAILALETEDEREAYELGLRYVQPEPVWGATADTAGAVRGLSLLGLVRVRHPDAAIFAAEALEDPERTTRAAAAQALAEVVAEVGLPLLRHKLEVGDAEPEVLGACLASFLSQSPEAGLRLAPRLLGRADEPVQEALLLALGESRRAEAFPVLRDYSGKATAVAYVAMALLRQEAATAHLLKVIASGPVRLAGQAVKALAHFRHDPALSARLRAAAAGRDQAFTAQVEAALALR
jgi:hypothetical protein